MKKWLSVDAARLAVALAVATSAGCGAKSPMAPAPRCSFTVMVKSPPRLTSTKFVAFGDSLTEGVVSLAPTVLSLDLRETA